MKPINFFVPGTPQPKTYNRGRGGSWYKSKECKEWEYWVKLHAEKCAPKEPLTCPIILGIIFTFMEKGKTPSDPHIKKPDLDNLLKSVTDAMEGTIYRNDSQVFWLHPSPFKQYGEKEGVDITVKI